MPNYINYRKNPIPSLGIFFMLRPDNPTRLDHIFFTIGNICVLAAVICGFVVYKQDDFQSTSSGWDKAFAISVLCAVTMLVLVGIRYIMQKQGGTFASQTATVFKRLFFWMFLPSIIITTLIMLLAYALGAFH